VVGQKAVVDACQGIDVTTWRAAGWRVWSLTGVPAGPGAVSGSGVPRVGELVEHGDRRVLEPGITA
jgi:hypothetical protein